MEGNKQNNNFFEKFSNSITQFTGSSTAFIIAFSIVVVWALSGPIFKFSETWQLVINTATTIITFLMVFLIQKAQNKDSKAIQLKLNELIVSYKGASNRMINIEELNEEDLNQLHKFYKKLADLAAKDMDIHQSHSKNAAEANHEEKLEEKKNENKSTDK